MTGVGVWPFEKRLEETLKRTIPKVGPEAGKQLASLLSPESLAITAGVLTAWIVSHFFAVGEVIDVILAAVGVLSVGLAIFAGIDHLVDFASTVDKAQTEADLDRAATHLAEAIAILGVTAVLAWFSRKAPKTRGRGPLPDPEPSRTPGLRYTPTIKEVGWVGSGKGQTSVWGDIYLSGVRRNAAGTAARVAEDAANELARFHESVHRLLTPKFYFLRNFRVRARYNGYNKSSLWRYIEEAFAQSYAVVRSKGFTHLFEGIRFPVKEGYVYLVRSGGAGPQWGGQGLVTEGLGLLATGTIAEMALQLWYDPLQSEPEPLVSEP